MPIKKNIADKPLPANKQKGKKKCSCCGTEKPLVDFYASANPLYSSDKRVPICKNCIRDLCIDKDTNIIDEVKLNHVLKSVQKPYFKDDLASAYSQFAKEHSYVDDENIKKFGDKVLGLYFKNTMLRQNKDLSYDDSEKLNFVHSNSNITVAEKNEILQKYSDINIRNTEEKPEPKQVIWTDQDNQNKNYAIEVVGYDPFDEYPEEGRKFLYNQLSPHLEDDSNVDDAYKLSQILQIIKNNYQIDTCDKKMSQLDPLKDADSIKTLSGIKNQLVQSNDKIAKENEISVKNRSDKAAGKSTLTYLMRDLREKDFDKAEADYYDQLRGVGTRWAVDMSITSIKQNGMFDENDKKEIYEMQLDLIDSLNQQVDELKEKVRLLQIDNDRLKAGVADGL